MYKHSMYSLIIQRGRPQSQAKEKRGMTTTMIKSEIVKGERYSVHHLHHLHISTSTLSIYRGDVNQRRTPGKIRTPSRLLAMSEVTSRSNATPIFGPFC